MHPSICSNICIVHMFIANVHFNDMPGHIHYIIMILHSNNLARMLKYSVLDNNHSRRVPLTHVTHNSYMTLNCRVHPNYGNVICN